MLGLINAIVSSAGAIAGYVKDGLVMANRFLTPPKLSHPAQGSAEFNGSSDYIQLPDPFSYTNHTIAAWVYVEDNASTKNIFDNRDADNDAVRFVALSNENIRYSLNSNDLTSSNAHANEWVYAVCSYDGTTQKLFINGSLDQSATISQTISTTTNALIGRQTYSAGNYFNGNLANVAIWNRALSSDEINSVMFKSYDSLEASEKNGLQAWYRLDDIDGTNVPDSSGNGNNGTAN